VSPPRVLFRSVSVDWPTPTKLYAALHHEFRFTLDPCPLNGEKHDGLVRSWLAQRVFCNPPYGRGLAAWLRKSDEARVAVYLLPARTDTSWFHELILPKAVEVRFLRGRLRFGDGPGRATFPSMIVVYR
jgi:site-specific DNA-methyltransferase (adenine-specific)